MVRMIPSGSNTMEESHMPISGSMVPAFTDFSPVIEITW